MILSFGPLCMFHPSQKLTRLVSVLGLALLSINGARECRALCLLASCGATASESQSAPSPGPCGTCCRTTKPACKSCQHAASVSTANLSHHSPHCPGGETCVCCAEPAPTQSTSPVDSQEVLDAMPLDGNLTAVVQYLNRHSERVADSRGRDAARIVSVCVALCRFVI